MVIVKTPLRLSFVGGGSDMKPFYSKQPGQVICTAIDKFVYAIVKERFDDMIYINYSKKECVEHVSEVRHDLVREAMKITGVEKGIEITTLADVPSSGSGLGSSSSITVALLHALYAYQNLLITAEQLAQDACRVEIDILKKPIGRQDQYAAAYGGVNQFIFHENETTTRIPVTMDRAAKRKFTSSLLLYYTGITRKADWILADQQKKFSEKSAFDAMVRMTTFVDPFREAMSIGNILECGHLLDENWRLKQHMAEGITNNSVEKMIRKARKAGAIGAKIAGAGGGGFLLLIAPREKQGEIMEAMKDYRELPFMLEESGSKVIFDDRSYSSK